MVIIKVQMRLSRFKAWLFSLTCLDSGKMMLFWFSVLVAQQIVSYAIEVVVWGEPFVHIFDSLSLIIIVALYFHYQSELGRLLLKGFLSKDRTESD